MPFEPMGPTLPKIVNPPQPRVIDDRVERLRATNSNPLYRMGLPPSAAYSALGKSVDFRSLAALANMGWRFQILPESRLPANIPGVVPGVTSGNANPANRVISLAAGGGNDIPGIAQHELGHAYGYEFGGMGSVNRAKATVTRSGPLLGLAQAPIGAYRGYRYGGQMLEDEANRYGNALMNMGGNKIEEEDKKISKSVKLTKNVFPGVHSGNSATKSSITKQYSGALPSAAPPPWALGIYGGIPPGSGLGPAWAQGIYGGVPQDKIMVNSLGKTVPYYAPHEPIGPTYYPPYQPGAPDISNDKNLGLLNANTWGGGGGIRSGGGGGRGSSPFGFSMGLINWRI